MIQSKINQTFIRQQNLSKLRNKFIPRNIRNGRIVSGLGFLYVLANTFLLVEGTADQFARFGSIAVSIGIVLLVLTETERSRTQKSGDLASLYGVLTHLNNTMQHTDNLATGKTKIESKEAFEQWKSLRENHQSIHSLEHEETITNGRGFQQDFFNRQINSLSQASAYIQFSIIIIGTIQWGYGDIFFCIISKYNSV